MTTQYNKSIIGTPRKNYEDIPDLTDEIIARCNEPDEPIKEIPKVNKKKGSNLEKKTGESSIVNPSSIVVPANIVSSDYIQIPGQDFIIAIGETDFNLNYEGANKAVLKRGLAVPTTNQFMAFHNYIIDCYKNNKPIFDSAGNSLSKKVKDDLYNQLTSNCWSWLNGKFNLSNNKNKIELITGLDSKNNLITKEEPLEICLMQDCYVDFTKLNKNGIPHINSKHSNQNYVKGENIYYWAPVNGRVARVSADSDGANLGCSRNPSNTSSSLGVFGIAQVLDPKLAGGKK